MMMLITISITMLIIMLSLDRCRGLFAPAGFAPAFLRLNLSNDLLDLGQCRRDPVTPQIALDQDGSPVIAGGVVTQPHNDPLGEIGVGGGARLLSRVLLRLDLI